MMGWFSKAIPERKWGDVSTTLGLTLRKERDSWYSTVQHSSASYGFLFVSDNISHTAIHCTSMLQLSAVAATLEENSYVSDLTFFLELVYIVLTENPPADLHRDIESSPFSRAGGAQQSLILWARTMARELSSNHEDPKLIEELCRYGALLVIKAKFATCEACGDRKAAEKTRNFFGN